MNAPVPASLLSTVELAPRDPILGITEAYNADPNPRKVNLGVGVYCDESGKVPLLECVKRAERELTDLAAPRSYLPIDGIPAYDREARALIFGAGAAAIAEGRVVTVQTLGGTGALKVGADFLRRFAPGAQVWISDPSWENHRALFEGAGFAVGTYPYYDANTRGLDFAGMIAALESLAPGSIVVLHACCHNPTGVDPTPAQWTRIIDVVRARGLVPILDLAYQGFGEGIDADAAVVRSFTATPGPLLVTSSFSKSFSLYGERVGALSVVTADKDEAARVLSQLKRLIRANYSNPPTHGGPDRNHRAVLTGAPRAVGGGARHDAQPHQADAGDARRTAARAHSRRRLPLHPGAARNVLLFQPDQGAGADAARGVLDLRDRHRARLRRGAQLAQRRRHRGGGGERDPLRTGGATTPRMRPARPPSVEVGCHGARFDSRGLSAIIIVYPARE